MFSPKLTFKILNFDLGKFVQVVQKSKRTAVFPRETIPKPKIQGERSEKRIFSLKMYPKIFKLLFHTCKVYFRLCLFLGIGSKQIPPPWLGQKPIFSGRVCGRLDLSSLAVAFELQFSYFLLCFFSPTRTHECVFSGVPSAPEKRVERRARKAGTGRTIMHHQGHLTNPHRAQGNRVGA